MTSLLKPIPSLHQKFMDDELLARVSQATPVSEAKLPELPVIVTRKGSALMPAQPHEAVPFVVSEVSLGDHNKFLPVELINHITLLRFEGVEQSITEWALDYGITPGIIIARLERGMTIPDAITTPMKVGHRGQRLPIFSRKQHNTSATMPRPKPQGAARAARPPCEPRARPVAGRPHNAKPIEHDGLSLTVREWSKLCGVPFNTIYQRLRLGWATDDALTPGDGRSRYGNRALLARKAGIDPRTVDSRMRRGWTLEQALTHEPCKGKRPGVSSDFERPKGTGGGSTAQETPNLSF